MGTEEAKGNSVDRKAAETLSRIVGGTPLEITPGNFQIAMVDTDGMEKVLCFEEDEDDGEPVASEHSGGR